MITTMQVNLFLIFLIAISILSLSYWLKMIKDSEKQSEKLRMEDEKRKKEYESKMKELKKRYTNNNPTTISL